METDPELIGMTEKLIKPLIISVFHKLKDVKKNITIIVKTNIEDVEKIHIKFIR